MTDIVYNTAERRLSLVVIITCTFGVGLNYGILMPLVALSLERRGIDTTMIGLNAAMQPLAMLVLAGFAARIVGRLGTVPSLLGGMLVGLSGISLMPVFTDLSAWFVLRFLIGVALALPWLVGETWINTMANEKNRARVVSIYAATFFSGLAFGPLVLQVTGTDNSLPFLVAAGSLFLSALPILLFRKLAPAMPLRAKLGLVGVLRSAPIVVAAALMAGYSESSSYALLPIYGLRSGLDQSSAVLMLSVFVLGAIVVQFPIGLVADRFDRRGVLLGLAGSSVVCVLLLPEAVRQPILLWPFLVVWGGVVLGFYTMALALLGQSFATVNLAAANALFLLSYEIGSVAGPGLAGAAMDIWDPQGFVAAQVIAGLVFLLVLVAWRPVPKTDAL